MFVLDELDKILQTLTPGTKKKRDSNRLMISLPDIERVDVNRMQLASKVRYPIRSAINELTADDRLAKVGSLNEIMMSAKHLTTDSLFASQMNPLILPRLTDTMDRHYPWAKLIICDRPSYDMLHKLKRVWSKVKLTQSGDMNNFIYKSPLNVTAIFLLSDIVDMIDREREPIVIVDKRRGTHSANFNYPLIRRLFPYIKISNLTILLNGRDQLQLGTFTINASREHQVLQFINHFARSNQVIELNTVVKLMGTLHLMYDNVLIVPTPDTRVDNTDVSILTNNRKALTHLSSVADKLVQLAEKLRLNLDSITYRAADPHGQMKVFTQMVVACLNSRNGVNLKTENFTSARVIVLDRLYDLLSPLFHSDRYGAYLEQEKNDKSLDDNQASKLRMGVVDELDEKLQLVELTDVLATILKYATSLKPSETDIPGAEGRKRIAQISGSLSSALATNQAIRRHLGMVKLIYKGLNEGYLLLLRLESNLETMRNELRGLTQALSSQKQFQVAEKVERIMSVFNQLSKTTGDSITAFDMIRVACIILDVINTFQSIHGKIGDFSKEADKTMSDIRQSLLSGSEFKKALKFKISSEKESTSSRELLQQLASFDKVSREFGGQKSTLTMEQILSKFQAKQLDQDTFPTVSLSARSTESSVIFLVFLGAMTPYELSKIKTLEMNWKNSRVSSSIYVLTCGLSRPSDFLKGL